MTATHRTPARLLALVGLAGALLVTGCGGSAATAAPTAAPSTPASAAAPATPAPTAAPTVAPTVAPTTAPATAAPTTAASASADATLDPALGGFAFPSSDVLAYYTSIGFTCKDPAPSTQAAGYTITRCVKADSTKGNSTIVALVTDPGGVTGDAFVGGVGSDGKTTPKPEDAITDLAFFLGAMLGKTNGTQASTWLATNLGAESAQTTIGDVLVGTYPGDAATGPGYFVEVANQAFMSAPAAD